MNSSLRKIAVLIASLDRGIADELLSQFAPVEADEIRRMVMALVEIEEVEEEDAIREFLNADRVVESDTFESLAGAPYDKCESEQSSSLSPARQASWAEDLCDTSDEFIARILKNECPQTVAIVLAELPAGRTSEIVSMLPDEQQADVLRRIVEINDSQSLELTSVRKEIALWLKTEIEAGLQRSQLISRLATVVESASQNTRDRILTNFAEFDSSMARDLRDQIGIDLVSCPP